MNDYYLKGQILESMVNEMGKPANERKESLRNIIFNPLTAMFEYDNKEIEYRIIKWLLDKQFICYSSFIYSPIGMKIRYEVNLSRPVKFQNGELEEV